MHTGTVKKKCFGMNMHTGTLEKKCSGINMHTGIVEKKCFGMHIIPENLRKNVPVTLCTVHKQLLMDHNRTPFWLIISAKDVFD
jgi:hypothetical protein